jgi:integrase
VSSITQPLPGVRLHPNGASWQVRIHPFKPEAGYSAVGEANERAVELRRLKRSGVTVAPPRAQTFRLATLRDRALEYLEDLADVGGRHGTPYSTAGLAKARQEARPWLGEPVPARQRKGVEIQAPDAVDDSGLAFADLPVQALTLAPVERYLRRRAKTTRRAAIGEQQALAKILRLASRRGDLVDPGLLALEPIRRTRTRRTGLSLERLRYLAEYAQPSQRRVFLLGATLGGRIMELLRSEDGWFDLDARTLTVPAWAAKERRERVIDLLPEEVALVREQRLARAAGTRRGPGGTLYTFPRPEGGPWNHQSGFWNRVIIPARRKAAEAWRAEQGLPAGAPTPFEWAVLDAHGRPVIDVDGQPRVGGFAPHDLRRGAADLLLELGLDAQLAAVRLGHKDGGHLLLTVYADSERRAGLRRELDRIAAEGGIAARLGRAEAVA